MAKLFDRVKVNVSGTPDQGTITVGSRASANFYLPAEVGAGSAEVYYLLLNATNDEEHGVGTVASDGSTVTRDRVISSIIGGTAGTTKINAGASSIMGFTSAAEAFRTLRGVRNVTGATDTLLELDGGGAINYNRATAIAATIPQAGASSSFNKGWYAWVRNDGVGTVTFTPTTSTINAGATLALVTGQSAFIYSDGTNYFADIFRGDISALSAVSGGLKVTGTFEITSAGASALSVGLNGATNPALLVDASTTSSATGVKIKSAAAAAGVAISVVSSGTNENLTIDAKGSGTVTIGGTSTGAISLARATSVTGALTVSGNTITGAAGTGSAQAAFIADGGSGSGGGGQLVFKKNGTIDWIVAHDSVIQGTGTTSHLDFYLSGGGIAAFFSSSDLSLKLNATTASTSTTTGALKVAGGLGVAGDIWASAVNATGGYFAGNVTLSGGAAINMVINSTADDARLYFMNSSATRWLLNSSSGTFFIYNGAFTAGVQLASQSATSWTAISDRRVKNNVHTLSVLDMLKDFRAIRYVNKLTSRTEIGIIAQEQIGTWPELVVQGSDDEDYKIESLEDRGAWGVSYDRFGVVAMQGLKELLTRVVALENRT